MDNSIEVPGGRRNDEIRYVRNRIETFDDHITGGSDRCCGDEKIERLEWIS